MSEGFFGLFDKACQLFLLMKLEKLEVISLDQLVQDRPCMPSLLVRDPGEAGGRLHPALTSFPFMGLLWHLQP